MRPTGAPAITVTIEAVLSEDGSLASRVRHGDSVLCERQAPLPREVAEVWSALTLPGLIAGDRMTDAGRRLAGTLFDDRAQRALAAQLRQLPADARAEVVLVAGGPLLSLPVELIRLSEASEGGVSAETGPLGLLPNVSVIRCAPGGSAATSIAVATPPPAGPDPSEPTPGPLKILAAVAAPDETKTENVPLDTEAEMGAVLDAVSRVAGYPHAQVRILEVASLAAIGEALATDEYHALHLSAHGSPDSVELEDEDGAPVRVTSQDLMKALKHAGKQVPLIVLSSCSGGATGSAAMAAGLLRHGADRVIAMLAPVTDIYATLLARNLYHELAIRPATTVGQALARARYETDAALRPAELAPPEPALPEPAPPEQLGPSGRSAHPGHSGPSTRPGQPARHVTVPEYGVATLLASRGDGPLVNPSLPEAPSKAATTRPAGRGVRELPLGSLIGRRPQLRDVMGVLRQTDQAVNRFGAASGVVLTGVGGIGKTAIAGRAISRLRDDGWLIAVHEGRWNPAGLIAATTQALAVALRRPGDPARSAELTQAWQMLSAATGDDGPKLDVIRWLLTSQRLLVVFDDFEQNLAVGGGAFLDSEVGELITALTDAAGGGALLITCRYPLPSQNGFLVTITVPPLSAAELRRMFLRMPALHDLDSDEKRMLMRAIGGHPRLIEFTDALLRGGRANLKDVNRKLRALANQEGVPLTDGATLETAINQAMVLGSADILLGEALTLLTPRQAAALHQVAACYGPMTLDDLAFALNDATGTSDPEPQDPGLADLRADVNRLTDLTLLTPGRDIEMHPWTADLVSRTVVSDPAELHDRALAMRYRRFKQKRGSYDDLIDIPRHLAALGRYGEIAGVTSQAARSLSGTLATCAYLTEILALIPSSELAWSRVADQIGDALLLAGNLPAARSHFEAALVIDERLALANPASTALQTNLSISHEKNGDIATAAGDLATARTHYQASLDITQQLAATDPANTGWQHGLSVSHEKAGDLATTGGDLATARTHYQASLDIRQRLTATHPANSQWQRDLSVSHNRVGDLATTAGDTAAARTHYQASLDIRQRLTATDPGNTGWQRDLSVSHEKAGDLAIAAGDPEAARTHYQASLDIRQQLTATDPGNTQWQRDLSVSHNKAGDLAIAAGDPATASTHYQASLDIRQRLTATDPANSQWQRDLSASHDNVANLAIAAGDLATARTHYQASLDIRRRLTAADPANIGWQRDLSVSHNKIGDVARAAGDIAAARVAYQLSVDIFVRLTSLDPSNAQWRSDLEIAREHLDRLPGDDS